MKTLSFFFVIATLSTFAACSNDAGTAANTGSSNYDRNVPGTGSTAATESSASGTQNTGSTGSGSMVGSGAMSSTSTSTSTDTSTTLTR